MFNLMFRSSRIALGITVFIGGCATVPADRGLSDVSFLTTARGIPSLTAPDDDNAQSQALINNLLGQQLSAPDALRIALMRNPRLRAEYSRLGIASAEVLQAGRLSNPTLSASVLFPNVAGEANQVGFGIAQNFIDLLMLPSRSRLAQGEFERAKAQAGAAVMDLTREVESAWYRLIGAQQLAAMRESVATAAASSAALAQRFYDAGNITDLNLSMEKAAAAQAELNAVSTQAKAVMARSELNVLMGLPVSETHWSVSDRLPLPVAKEDDLLALQTLADHQRLDLAAARQEVALLRDALDVTKSYSFVGSAEVGVMTERETDRSRITGPTLSLQLPIFNQNQSGVLRALSSLEQAEADLKSLEIETGNSVALAHAKVLTSRKAVELFRDKLVPLRERVVERTQERVNYMLVGIFDLVRAKQDEYDTYQNYLEAVRDYWLARTELALAVGTQLPSSSRVSAETVAPERPQPAPESSSHMSHGMDSMQGMPGMDMDGMKGMKGMKGMEHSGHDMKEMPGMKMDDMKGMNHAGQGMGAMPSKGKGDTHSGYGMKGMPGMDMGGMKGMDHSGHEHARAKSKPPADAHADHDMKSMEGMPAMEGMDQAAPDVIPADVKAACDQLKNADPNDPLTKALTQKCHSQDKHPADHATIPATGLPPTEETQHHSGDHHHHH